MEFGITIILMQVPKLFGVVLQVQEDLWNWVSTYGDSFNILMSVIGSSWIWNTVVIILVAKIYSEVSNVGCAYEFAWCQ